MRRAALLHASLLLALSVAPAARAGVAEVMAATVKGEYEAKADSLAHCLVSQFMSQSKGTFYSTPGDAERSSQYIYWQQAHAMDVLVHAYERHKGDDSGLSTRYRGYMTRWYASRANNYSGGATGFENPYTDDMCWICLTLLHMTRATGLASYAATARKLFDNTIMRRAVEDSAGLWLPWNTDAGSGPNACTLSPACLTAALLREKFGDQKYLDQAEKLYTYMERHIVKADGRVEEPPLTYTQGTFGEACRLLYHITGKTAYRTKAQQYITYAFNSGRCTNGAGILRDEGSSMDQSIFKAVLIPYAVNFVLDDKMPLTARRSLSALIQKNADTLWGVLDKDAYPRMYCPCDWTRPYDTSRTASMGAMASGASLLEGCARMCRALRQALETGVRAPGARDSARPEGVYTTDGRLVRAPWRGTRGLPAGLYVINGRKVTVR